MEVEAVELYELWVDRGCDCNSENEWDGLCLDDGRASEVAAWEYGGDGERVTKCDRLGTGKDT